MKKLVVLTVCAAAAFAGCAADAPDDLLPGNNNNNNDNSGPAPSVVVTGTYSVLIGETLSITVTTENGTDASYTYDSDNSAIASVADGVITGLSAGETLITVTGDDTGATSNHPVVVLAEPIDDEVPFLALWQSSGHSDSGAEAFRHWDEDGEIPTRCAKCHSSDGFRDYLGDDMTAQRSVENPVELGQVVDCNACHNSAALGWDTVTFPTDTEETPTPVSVSGLGREAVCMECHQGRSSGPRVLETITNAKANAGTDDDDMVLDELGIQNPHYYPAAATLFAGLTQGGFQFDPLPNDESNGMVDGTYDRRFRHVPTFEKCTDCHDAHSTQVKFDECSECHEGVSDLATARDIRMIASFGQDYDGDNNTSEGIYYEIDTLRSDLFDSIEQYGADRGSTALICYNNSRYPYFFKDDDTDASTCPDDADRYDQWTPRLVRAAYNYLLATTERGGFAHNAKYIIQLLVDAIRDINEGISPGNEIAPPVASVRTRTDVGHFNGGTEAFRHWDDPEAGANEAVSSSCAACHSGSPGYRFYVEFGAGLSSQEPPNGLDCYTCHDAFGTQPEDYILFEVADTRLPDESVTTLDGTDNLCANCHIGRASKASYDDRFASENYSFSNVHYLAAAGQVYGTETSIGYEFDAETYAAKFDHGGSGGPVSCTGCHSPGLSNHSFSVDDTFEAGGCAPCHTGLSGPDAIIPAARTLVDYDGDGSASESPEEELEGLAADILDGLGDRGICYNGDRYPYFFVATSLEAQDTGVCGVDDTGRPDSNTWGADDAEREETLSVAHNYQLYARSPGAWAHNFDYMQQLLYDSACKLGTLPGAAVRAGSTEDTAYTDTPFDGVACPP